MKKRNIEAVVVTVLLMFTMLAILIVLSNNQTVDDSALLPEKTNCTIQKNIQYVYDSNPYHLMDIYSPVGDGPFPAIIYLHGGGWVEGNRSDFSEIAAFYAKRGIAGFSIDYTLASGNTSAWPQNINDVISALQFINENAEIYRIDTQRIALLGSSAGAHLASLVGTLSGDEAFLENTNFNQSIHTQVRLVINYEGVEDLEFVGQNRTENNNLLYSIVSSQFGNVTYSQNPQLWREASPATYISADDPVFVFVHGVNDRIVPIQVAESFNTKLLAEGVITHFIKIEGDHDILTNEAMNLEARYSLDPILKSTLDP